MRKHARLSLRHVGLLALVGTTIGLACNDDGPLSDEEMTLLRGFTLPEAPPIDWSNVYGDSLDAQRLGKLLYFDPRYAGRLGEYNVEGTNGALGAADEIGKVSCAGCHDPLGGGADHRSLPGATSLGASYTARNAPTVINAAYTPLWQFWDGHADSLWGQALAPPEGNNECNGSRLAVARLIFEKYRDAYEAAFPEYPLPAAKLAFDRAGRARGDSRRFPFDGRPGNQPGCQPNDGTEPFRDAFDCMADADQASVNRIYANFGKAIAAYERRLVSTAFTPSPFDAFMAGDVAAMPAAAVRGARLFVGRAGCVECHRGATFTDFSFHNIGVPQTGEYVPATDDGRFDGIGVVMSSQFTRASEFSDDSGDAGHLNLNGPAPASAKGQFKTPTLRNVAVRPPYMHQGQFATLRDVLRFYSTREGATAPGPSQERLLVPLHLTEGETSDLIAFLEALTDEPIDDALLFRPGDPQAPAPAHRAP
jgi:cytochrome c peroxidase